MWSRDVVAAERPAGLGDLEDVQQLLDAVPGVPTCSAPSLAICYPVRKFTRTTWARSSAGPGGLELSHAAALPSEGMCSRSNTVV